MELVLARGCIYDGNAHSEFRRIVDDFFLIRTFRFPSPSEPVRCGAPVRHLMESQAV